MEELKEGKLHFVLTDITEVLPVVELNPDIANTPFSGYDTLHLVRDVEGEITAATLVGLVTGSSTATAAGGLAGIGWSIGAMAINMAIAMAVSAVIQAIIPTQEFTEDPSASQNSPSLYNNSPLVREQGGSVPLICGEPFCGGALISSSLSTAEDVIETVNDEKYAQDGLEWFNIPIATFTPTQKHLYLGVNGPVAAVEATFQYWDGVTETLTGIIDPAAITPDMFLSYDLYLKVKDYHLNRFDSLLYGFGGWNDIGDLSRYTTTVRRETNDGGATYFFNILYKKQVFA